MPFLAAVELDDTGHPQHVRFDVLADVNGPTLAHWACRALPARVHLVTDGLASLSNAGAVVAGHGAIIVARRQPAAGLGVSLNASTP